MTTKAKKTKDAKKKVRKTPVKTNFTPALECPVTVDFRTPHSTESSGRLVALRETLLGKVTAWTDSVRAYFADGSKGKLPQFDPKYFPTVNKSIQTQKQYDALVERWNDGEAVSFAPRYNPALIELVHAMNAVTLRRGLVSKNSKPRNWDEKLWGKWELLDDDGKYTVPSGWFFDKNMPRRCHAKTAEGLVDDAASNIFTIGTNRYVVGDGTSIRCAAMLVWATKRGNYRAGDSARKRMSIAANKDVVDVIFRIEDRANNGGGVTVKADWGDISEMVFLPGQVLTAGFLFNAKGKRLIAKDIRALDGDTKGLKFKTVSAVLGGPIVGKAITRERLWAEIQTIEGNAGLKLLRGRKSRGDAESTSPQTKTMRNLRVQCRVSPNEAFPFGLRAAQADMVPFIENGADGEFSMGVVIGDRSNLRHNVGVTAAKTETETETETETPSKKSVKKSPAKKSAKKGKTPDDAAAKKTADDAAPEVEHDTSDEKKTVEAS